MRVRSLGIITVPSPGTPVSIGQTMATISGTEAGTFNIVVNSNDKLLFSVDGGADQTVTLTAGAARTATQVVGDINGGLTGATASVAANRVNISSNTAGSGGSILVQAVTHSANTTLGFVIGLTSGIQGERCCKISLTPVKGNAGDVYVGAKVNFDKTTGDGLLDRIMKPLASPATLDTFRVETGTDANLLNTQEYFIDADNANDGVMASIWVA